MIRDLTIFQFSIIGLAIVVTSIYLCFFGLYFYRRFAKTNHFLIAYVPGIMIGFLAFYTLFNPPVRTVVPVSVAVANVEQAPEGVEPEIWSRIPENDRSLWPDLSERIRELLLKKYGSP